MQDRKAAWTRSDLTRAINAALPDYLGIPDGADIGRLLDQLTVEALRYAIPLDAARPGEDALPDALRRDDGESSYQAHGAQLYCTPDHIRTERILSAATAPGGAAALRPEMARRFLERLRESGIELGVDQAAAVRGVLTSGAQVESLVGPAGHRQVVRRRRDRPRLERPHPARRRAAAAGVRAGDLPDRHRRPGRRRPGRAQRHPVAGHPGTARRGPGSGRPQPVEGDEAWRLHAGDLVVVDESAMTDTPALALIHRYVEQAGAKLLLVGDHRQLAAIGAGGGMELLAQTGATLRAHRGPPLHPGMGTRRLAAAARRRRRPCCATTTSTAACSTPAPASRPRPRAARSWLADTLAGKHSLLLVDDNEQAARLSAQLRTELVRLGRVQEHGVPLDRQGTFAGVGDVVQARFNGWDLAGVDGNRRGPINRETYQVVGTRDDGGLDVVRVTGGDDEQWGSGWCCPPTTSASTSPSAYAVTVHAAQGQDVDTTHAVVTPRTSRAALYVELSRGREENTAHIATLSGPRGPRPGPTRATPCTATRRRPRRHPRRSPPRRRRALRGGHRDRIGRRRRARADRGRAARRRRPDGRHRTHRRLARPAHRRRPAHHRPARPDRRRRRCRIPGPRCCAGPSWPATTREQVLADAVADRPLDGARNPTHVIYARITKTHERDLDPVGDAWADWTPRTDNPEWRDYLDRARRTRRRARRRAGPPDRRRRRRRGPSRRSARYRPIRSNGPAGNAAPDRSPPTANSAATSTPPRPSAPPRRRDSPRPTRPSARHGAPSAGPETDREELQLSDGQLRTRIRAYEREVTWAPRYVANELAGTRQAAARQRELATLRAAEAVAAEPRRPRTPAPGIGRRRRRWPRSSTSAPHSWPRSTTPARAGSPTPRKPASAPSGRRPSSPSATPTTPSPKSASRPRSGSTPTARRSPPTSADREITEDDVRDDDARRRAGARRRRPRRPRDRRGRATTGQGGRGPRAHRRRERPLAGRRPPRPRRDPQPRESSTSRKPPSIARPSSPAGTPTTRRPSASGRRRRRRVRIAHSRWLSAAQPAARTPATSSGGGPECRHAHRSVARIASHQPGRCSTRSGRATSSCSATRYSASIDSS